jgi:hypothetical protein
VFFDKTRFNMCSYSDGDCCNSSNCGNILHPHLTEPHLEGDGKLRFFWGCIAANGSYYDTTDMDGLINSTAYTSILHKLLSWAPSSTMMA